MLFSAFENGMSYALRSYGNAVGYCSLSIRTGTRNEEGFHSGIAHFVEHTLFKGTSRKSSAVINNCLERLGGELNAYTTKEEIVLHATVLKKDLPKAVSLLLEIAFDANFPEEEVEIEKGVVIDEIASCKDYPAEEIYDLFEEKLFGGTELSRPILGTEESVRAMDSAELRRFRERFFTPDRMVLTLVSPLPEEKMLKIVRKAVASTAPQFQSGNGVRTASVPQGFGGARFNETIDKGNNQVNCVIGGIAPSLADEEQRIATLLLCNILGGPASNSLLGAELREKHGWVYNVECNYTPYSDTGVATINFGCDRENIDKCIRAIGRQLHKLQTSPLSARRLAAAKRQILGQNAIGMENGESQCLSMGKSMLSFGRIATDEETQKKVMSVSADQLRMAACSVFGKDNTSTLIFL